MLLPAGQEVLEAVADLMLQVQLRQVAQELQVKEITVVPVAVVELVLVAAAQEPWELQLLGQ